MIVKFLLPFLLVEGTYELHRDEYLYLSEADHLGWGYMEAPPFLSLLGKFSQWMGYGFAWVRLWPALFGAMTMYLVGRIVLMLGGGRFAVWLAGGAFLLSGFLRMHMLFMPNFLEVFFWTFDMFLIIRLLQDEKPRDMYLLAFSLAAGFLSKYSTVFFMVATAIAFAITPLRSWFRSKHTWYALTMFMVIILPNVIWQVVNGFPLATHMRLLREQQLQHMEHADFLKDQLLICFPGFFVWMTGLWSTFMEPVLKKYRVVGFITLLVAGFLFFMRGKGYYTAGLFPALMALGAVTLEKVTTGSGIVKRTVRVAMFIFLLTTGILLLPMAMPFASPEKLEGLYVNMGLSGTGPMRWEDNKFHPLPQDFSDMLGWREMAQKTRSVLDRIPDSERVHTLVFGDNYGETSSINYFRRQYGLPMAFSDDASFLFWLPSDLSFRNILLIDFKPRPTDDIVFGHFRSVVLMDSVTQPYARERGAKFYYYSDPDDSMLTVTRRVIREMKAAYNMK